MSTRRRCVNTLRNKKKYIINTVAFCNYIIIIVILIMDNNINNNNNNIVNGTVN